MSTDLLHTLPTFAPAFFRALGVNLSLAADALAIGLPAGLVLGWSCLPRVAPAGAPADSPVPASIARQGAARVAGLVLALLRAAPAFVVMYVLLHALPARWAVSPGGAVSLSLAAYAAAFVADNLMVAVLDQRSGARGGALLFLMALVRAYFVMVLSSGFGAAIGVTEATAVTLKALEQLPSASDRLGLIGGVVLVFVAMRQVVHLAIVLVNRYLARRRKARV